MARKKKEDLTPTEPSHFHIKFTAFGCSEYEIQQIKDSLIREWNKQSHNINNTQIIAVPET